MNEPLSLVDRLEGAAFVDVLFELWELTAPPLFPLFLGLFVVPDDDDGSKREKEDNI